MVSHVATLLGRVPLLGNCRLVLDRTRVGRPVADMFAWLSPRPVAVTITGGDSDRMDGDGGGHHVAKINLISQLQALFHAGELKTAISKSSGAIVRNDCYDVLPRRRAG